MSKREPELTLSTEEITTRETSNIGPAGLRIERLFTKDSKDPFAGITFENRSSRIVNPDGSIVYEVKDVEVPDFWSQVATDILAQKYLRKKGVPQFDDKGEPILDDNGGPVLGGEKSAKQAVGRLASTWRWWGESYGYFNRKVDAQVFEDEIKYMLIHQMMAPNSPQWFNTGLKHAYNITGSSQGHWYADPETGESKPSPDAFSHPQVHGCYIQGLKDDLVNEGGILDLAVREARVFKYGSGTGSNFSALRGKGEHLSGGGTSSGMMSFLNIFDATAGSIKSGGTTRRAAKMVSVDIDHPEIEKFIEWKVVEEQKVADIVTGSFINYRHLKEIMHSAENKGIDPEKNPELKGLIKKAVDNYVPESYIKRVLQMVQNGVKANDFDFRRYDTDFRSEAYSTVGGQNANNSVRVTNDFLEAVEQDKEWHLINRTDSAVAKTLKARDLWNLITYSAWASADPGLQFHTTINEWHTCKADGDIHASNPCSEYMFLDDTACNLASFNLLKFYNPTTGEIEIEKYRHAIRLVTIVLEISVLMSQIPSKAMAEGTYKYRTLGLGYADLGALLMTMGIPYDSELGYAMTATLTAILTGEAYATSAEMAKALGPFQRYEANKQHMLRVIRNHRRAAYNTPADQYEELRVKPTGIDPKIAPKHLLESARRAWDYAIILGEKYGFRNANVSVLAPTGTIGLVMDCDTTGIEPDFALVKFKKLVGGGYFKLVNQSVSPALQKLGYNEKQIQDIIQYTIGAQTLVGAPNINTESLKQKGFTDKVLAAVEAALPGIFELKYAFTKWTMGEDFCLDTLKLSESQLNDPNLNILETLGFTSQQIQEAEQYICGMMTTEGAPHLKEEHYPVFDCASKNGKYGKRYISYRGHLNQMAAAQPFLSGAISKTINLPEEATFEDIAKAYTESWKKMTKAVALYRDGSKLSQPLNAHSADEAFAKLFDFSTIEDVNETIGAKELQTAAIQAAPAPKRRRLPDERHSITHKFSVGGQSGYITVGLYEDGTPGEIFMFMQKTGSTLRGIMDVLGVSLSWNLQYGVPLEELIRKLTYVRFEPAGMTGNKEIPIAKSIFDYIGRWLAIKFLKPEVAKKYHSSELVNYSYEQGSNARILIPFINGKGRTELSTSRLTKTPSLEDVIEQAEAEEQVLIEEVRPEASYTLAESTGSTGVGTISQIELDLGAEEAILQRLSKQQEQKSMASDDAEICSECGSVMVRQGNCFFCRECGSTSGCS